MVGGEQQQGVGQINASLDLGDQPIKVSNVLQALSRVIRMRVPFDHQQIASRRVLQQVEGSQGGRPHIHPVSDDHRTKVRNRRFLQLCIDRPIMRPAQQIEAGAHGRQLLADLLTAGAEHDVHPVAEPRFKGLREDLAPLGAIVRVSVGRRRCGVGDRLAGDDAGAQAALLGVLEQGLGGRPVLAAAHGVWRLADHAIARLHPGHDRGHAVG
ncbi:hypothetical protein D3C72_1637810 [compost metagenome]